MSLVEQRRVDINELKTLLDSSILKSHHIALIWT